MEEFVYMGRGQTVPEDVVSVRFHPSVTEVENGAFEDCSQLREIVFNDGMKKIGQSAFEDCSSLQSITLPTTVTEIGEAAFSFCSNLREVGLHDGPKKISSGAFANCESITLPSTLTAEIGRYAFQYCNSLREVELPEGLQTIGVGAFRDCSLLERFTVPRISTRLNIVIEMETDANRTRQLNEIDAIRGDMIVRSGSELFVPGAVIMPVAELRPNAPRNDLTATSFDSKGTIAPPRGIDIILCDDDASIVEVLALTLRKEGLLVIAELVGFCGAAEHACKSMRRRSEGSRFRIIGCCDMMMMRVVGVSVLIVSWVDEQKRHATFLDLAILSG